MTIETEYGRQDIEAETRGQVVHLTQFAFDGPGRRRRPIDQLRDDGVISAAGHAAGERYLDLAAALAPPLSGSQADYAPAATGSRCLTNDQRLDILDAAALAHTAVLSAVGFTGLEVMVKTMKGHSLAALAFSRGYRRSKRGHVVGDPSRMHSQVRDAYDALAAHFGGRDQRVAKVR